MAQASSLRRLRGLALVLAGALAGCEGRLVADDAPASAPEVATLRPVDEVLAGAHIPTLDPATLNGAQIAKVVGAGPLCLFRYTSAGRPVLAFGLQADGAIGPGLVRLNGSLVQLEALRARVDPAGVMLAAGPVRLGVLVTGEGGRLPTQGRQVEADMGFEVAQALTVGYAGFLECRAGPPLAVK
ncbi:hypothetical protein [Ramlibacter rhizophilus]|uniref:Uncharacterized protein n=1 Tax=Ramlibacter rhizophilus TaxID=1781167 RepID=A0A4Z0C082_9BURK|nr:hypothetical protein [Ramlibacter rhizophilus]TFZ05007.1 hypothetical protein EZ242_04475 [Ramlibacter rhizophilus]